MRFVFVDRLVSLEPGRVIETLKNVAATEDVFDDHFPGCPILPGALILEAMDQAAQLLIAATHDFRTVGSLTAVPRASFGRVVRPGDQVTVRCRRMEGPAERWTVGAAAEVGGRRVALATLEFVLEEAGVGETAGRAERLRAMLAVLREGPLDRVELRPW